MNKIMRNSPIEYTSWKVCVSVAIVFFLIVFVVAKVHIFRAILFSIGVLLLTRISGLEHYFEEELGDDDF